MEGQALAKNLAEGQQLDLTMVKIDGIPHPDSAGYVQLQVRPAPDQPPSSQNRFPFWRRAALMSSLLAVAHICMLKRWPRPKGKWVKLGRMERRFLAFIAYVVYLLEALLNRTAAGLTMLNRTEGVLEYIEKIKACKPAPEVQVQCYHFETRYSAVVDEDGSIHTESWEERVNTASFTEGLKVSRWEDVTGDVAYGLRYFPLLQVHFEVRWEVGDRATSREHQEQRLMLRRRAEAADYHHDATEKLRLVDEDGNECAFRRDMIGTTGGSPPKWLGLIPYAVCTCFGLSWPYRYWLSRQAIKGEVIFRKKVWSSERAAT